MFFDDDCSHALVCGHGLGLNSFMNICVTNLYLVWEYNFQTLKKTNLSSF